MEQWFLGHGKKRITLINNLTENCNIFVFFMYRICLCIFYMYILLYYIYNILYRYVEYSIYYILIQYKEFNEFFMQNCKQSCIKLMPKLYMLLRSNKDFISYVFVIKQFSWLNLKMIIT